MIRVRFHIIRNACIENVGKSQSCMVSKLRIIWKQTVVPWAAALGLLPLLILILILRRRRCQSRNLGLQSRQDVPLMLLMLLLLLLIMIMIIMVLMLVGRWRALDTTVAQRRRLAISLWASRKRQQRQRW